MRTILSPGKSATSRSLQPPAMFNSLNFLDYSFLCSHRINSGTWASTTITKGDGNKTSIQDFLSSWVKSGHEAHKLIDSCIGAHCNPTCPDEIVFVDAAEVWNKVVKAVIVGLSLVITVLCTGLKGTFVYYYSHLTKRQEIYLNDSETSQARKEV